MSDQTSPHGGDAYADGRPNGDWSLQPLRTLVLKHKAGIYKSASEYGQGTPIVGVSDLFQHDEIAGQPFRLVKLSKAEKAEYALSADELLYAESSLVFDGIAKTLAVTPEGAGTAFAWHTRKLVIDKSRIDAKFLSYVLGSSDVRAFVRTRATQTALTGIPVDAYLETPVPVPTITEQYSITAALDAVERTIRDTDRLIAKLKAMKAGLLHDLLTKGIDENGELRKPEVHPEQFKESHLGPIPKNWCILNVGGLYSDRSRNGLYKGKDYYGSGILMIHMPQMFRGPVIDFSDAVRVRLSDSEIKRYALLKGDLLFARRSLTLEGAGQCSIVPALSEPVAFESSIIRVRLREEEILPAFANIYLNSEIGFRLRLPLIRQVAVSGVSSEDIASIPMVCPPIPEQERILAATYSFDAMADAELVTLEKLKLVKKGLTEDLLTGRVRVVSDNG